VTERSGRRRAIAAVTGVLGAGLILGTGAVGVSARPVVVQQVDSAAVEAVGIAAAEGLG